MSPRMIQEGRVLLTPDAGDLADAVDITDYVTTDGVQIDSAEDSATEAFQTAYRYTLDVTAEDIRKIADAMNALVDGNDKRVERATNTNKKYPTSTPPWARRKR